MFTTRLLMILAIVTVGNVMALEHLPPITPDANPSAYDEKTSLATSQEALGRTVGNYTFFGSHGQRVALEALRGKPVVISMIYTSCYHICPTLTKNLAKVVKVARDALGNDSFTVLTIGFDTPVDTPDRMGLFARKQGVELSDWHFVSTDTETIEGLSKDIGFQYFPSAKGFDHLIQTTVLDAEGKVYRQIYGIAPEPPSLVEPLKELLYGKRVDASPIKGLINNIRLFCTVYDPTTGKYHFDYSIFIGIAIGLLALSAIAIFIIRAWRGSSPRDSTV